MVSWCACMSSNPHSGGRSPAGSEPGGLALGAEQWWHGSAGAGVSPAALPLHQVTRSTSSPTSRRCCHCWCGCRWLPLLPPPPHLPPKHTEDDPDREQSKLEKLLLGPGSHLALAMLCSKMCIPLKLPVAAGLTPYVYR